MPVLAIQDEHYEAARLPDAKKKQILAESRK
jgi:hypothetical protein